MKQHFEIQRLIFRSWQEEDILYLTRLNDDDKVMEYFLRKLSYQQTIALYSQIREKFTIYGFGAYSAGEKEIGVPIGFVGLYNVTFEVNFAPAVEILWRLLPEFWGKRYATETTIACLDYAKEGLKLKEIVPFTSSFNRRSEHVIRKVGMTCIEEFDHPLVGLEYPLYRHILYKAVL